MTNDLKVRDEDGLVMITHNGKAIATLIPIDDEKELERLVLAYSKQFQLHKPVSLLAPVRGCRRKHLVAGLHELDSTKISLAQYVNMGA
jgi:hypothetical protein